MDIFEVIKQDVKKALEMMNRGNETLAINILNRCMRRLEKYLETAKGSERLKAISLMKFIGQIQTNISERKLESIKEDEIHEEEVLKIKEDTS